MEYEHDIARLREIAEKIDPAFRLLDSSVLNAEFEKFETKSKSTSVDFILGAMHICALAKNGHTRAIPNTVIDVAPMRLVWFADGPFVVAASGPCSGLVGSKLSQINGRDVLAVFDKMSPWLAGTAQRKEAIGTIILAWPKGLAEILNMEPEAPLLYSFRSLDGGKHDFDPSKIQPISAKRFYPVYEHGIVAEIIHRNGLAADGTAARTGRYCFCLGKKKIWYVRLGDFADSPKNRLANDMSRVLSQLSAAPKSKAVVDLRGNPGGTFLPVLEFCKHLSQLLSPPASIVILVDKFTFSAAIVVAALLAHYSRPKPSIFGEVMGDHTQFFAEGGTDVLPSSGLLVRYSTGYHDWFRGQADAALTPVEIADEMIAAGALLPDKNIPFTGPDFFSGKDVVLEAAILHLDEFS